MAARVVCTACGYEDPRDSMCVMSDDGEGPHAFVTVTPISAEDAEFLRRVAIHHEQGAQER